MKAPNIGQIVTIKGKDCIVVDFHGMRAAIPVDLVRKVKDNK